MLAVEASVGVVLAEDGAPKLNPLPPNCLPLAAPSVGRDEGIAGVLLAELIGVASWVAGAVLARLRLEELPGVEFFRNTTGSEGEVDTGPLLANPGLGETEGPSGVEEPIIVSGESCA